MDHPMAIEDIEEMRRQEGIEDKELEEAVSGLKIGDTVRLTLLSRAPTFSSETLPVRITSIGARSFRGKLARNPASAALSHLAAGSTVAFTAAHIHSVLSKDRAQGMDAARRRVPKPLRGK